MINDPTILRFSNSDSTALELGIEEVASVCRSLENAFRSVAQLLGDSEVKLFLVAGPRSGSIELLLRPEIQITINAMAVAVPAKAEDRDVLEMLAQAGTLAGAIWIIVFGQRGVFELWKQKRLNVAEADSAEFGEIRLTLTERALQNPNVQEEFRRLTTAALRAGADRTEIEVRDSEPVTVASRSERRGFGKAAIGYEAHGNRQNPVRIVRDVGEPVTQVRYDGRDYPAFLATAVSAGLSEPVVCVWASTLPVPKLNVATDVQSQVIPEPSRIEFIGDAPLAFERAKFAALISASKGDWL